MSVNFPGVESFFMKHIVVLMILVLCSGLTGSLWAESGGKTLHILYSADERGSIIPCG